MDKGVQAARTSIVAILLLLSMNFGKVSPAMPDLIAQGAGASLGGFLMSAFAAASIAAAITDARLLRRFGRRRCIVYALLLSAIGAVCGLVLGSPDSAIGKATLLVSRVLEGFGFGIVCVQGPAIVAAHSSDESRGLAMGFWGAAVPVGLLVVTLVSIPIVDILGWRGAWLAGLVAVLAALPLCRLQDVDSTPFMSPETEAAGSSANVQARTTTVRELRVFGLLLAVEYFAFNFGVDSFNDFSIAYLNVELGIPYDTAGLVATAGLLAMVAGSFAGGAAVNKTSAASPVPPILMLMVCLFFSVLFRIHAGVGAITAYQTAAAFCFGMLPSVFCYVASVAAGEERLIDKVTSIMVAGQNLGTLTGPAVVGAIVDASGWASASGAILAIGCAGLAAAVALAMYTRRRGQTRKR